MDYIPKVNVLRAIAFYICQPCICLHRSRRNNATFLQHSEPSTIGETEDAASGQSDRLTSAFLSDGLLLGIPAALKSDDHLSVNAFVGVRGEYGLTLSHTIVSDSKVSAIVPRFDKLSHYSTVQLVFDSTFTATAVPR